MSRVKTPQGGFNGNNTTSEERTSLFRVPVVGMYGTPVSEPRIRRVKNSGTNLGAL